jgi:signal transduction histidine kinase
MAQTTLELCTMDTAELTPEPRAVEMGSAIKEHLRLLKIVADAVEVSLVSEADPAAPNAQTVADRVWIVLDNLVFNALKHARSGTAVTVSVRGRDNMGPAPAIARATGQERRLFRRSDRLSGRPGSRYVEVSVHNHGTPINPSRIETIFSELARDPSPPARLTSTGLGLSIVEQCVHQLGGAVWVASSGGDGTRFSFTLPSELA